MQAVCEILDVKPAKAKDEAGICSILNAVVSFPYAWQGQWVLIDWHAGSLCDTGC